MNIYLDNNIVVDIEDGKYTLKELLSKIGITQSKIFYSSVHITEADEMNAQDKAHKIDRRFRTISFITSNNYIHINPNTHAIHKQIVRPTEIFKRHKYWTNKSSSGAFQKTELNPISQDQKIAFRESLEIDPKEINNYTIKDVIEKFEVNKAKFGNMSLSELIETATRIKLGRSATTMTKIITTFELLDLIGFWKDIYTTKSDFARAQDSQHCFSASICDYFISNDKRMRNKSRLVYDIFNINTKVVDSYGIE